MRCKLILFSLLFFTPAMCQTALPSFDSLPDSELIALRHEALDRIRLTDEYLHSVTGIPPEEKPEVVLSAFETLVTAGHDWNKMTRPAQVMSDSCQRFFRNSKFLIKEIENNYLAYQKLDPESDGAILLRARLEGLGLFLNDEMELVAGESEGGKAPVTNASPQICLADNRKEFESASQDLEKSLNTLYEATWGAPGLRNAFPLSSKLLIMANKRQNFQNEWGPTELVGETIVGFLLAGLVTKGFISVVALAPKIKLILTTVGITSMAAYGAYQGKEKAKEKQKASVPYMVTSWEELQYSAEQTLDLPINNLTAYYELTSYFEKSKLEYNKSISSYLKPRMEIAVAKFGSLSAAEELARTKLSEIQTVMRKRNIIASN